MNTILRSLFLLILLSLLLTACSNSTSQQQSQTRELLPDPEKFEHDKNLFGKDTSQFVFVPDTAIGMISLHNSENVDEFLGADVMKWLVDEDLPKTSFLSADDKQKLTVIFHPGGVRKEFSEFLIEYNHDRKTTRKTNWMTVAFETESNVALGITEGFLLSKKGEPQSLVPSGDLRVFHYEINDYANSLFLKKYKMPVYYADYSFKDGYLMSFKFGFVYP